MVKTALLLFKRPSFFKHRAEAAIILSPSNWRPFSSDAITRSASPSKLNPTKAFSFWVNSCINCVCNAPTFLLMLVPSGLAAVTTTSIPSPAKTFTATLELAPLAQSNTTLVPFNKEESTVDIKNFSYSLTKDTSSFKAPFGEGISCKDSISASMEFSNSSGSFVP